MLGIAEEFISREASNLLSWFLEGYSVNTTSSEMILASDTSSENGGSFIERACTFLARKDFIYLAPERTRGLIEQVAGTDSLSDWSEFCDSWNNLRVDDYMRDGGRYRKRRHATLSALPSSRLFQVEPHRPHFQSLQYNHLNGGVARHYEPIEKDILRGATMSALIKVGCEIFGRLAPYYPWHIEVHQFRIEADKEMEGKPTPEGIHRDGVNYVMMVMVQRRNLINGATTIYDLGKNRLNEFTLQNPLDMAIVNDERVFHGVTPIVQLGPELPAVRDVLVITFHRRF